MKTGQNEEAYRKPQLEGKNKKKRRKKKKKKKNKIRHQI